MGDPVTTGLIASAVMGGVSSIQQGMAQSAQYKTQAKAMELQSAAAETNAAVEEAQRRERLREILSTQKAQMAGAGVSSSSISGRVLEEASTNAMMKEQRLANLSSKVAKGVNDINISGTKAAAKSAVVGGVMSGLASAGTAGFSAYKIGGAKK